MLLTRNNAHFTPVPDPGLDLTLAKLLMRARATAHLFASHSAAALTSPLAAHFTS